MANNLLMALLAICLVGCEDQAKQQSAPLAAVEKTKTPTVEDWNLALRSTYKELELVKKGDGTSTFYICFIEGDRCDKSFEISGERDDFRKLRFFNTLYGRSLELLNSDYSSKAESYVDGYVALKECHLPSYVLKVKYHAKRGLLFMQRIAVMADGVVVLDKDVSHEEISSGVTQYGATEVFQFVLNETELAGIRKAANTKDVVIRITGRTKFVTVNSSNTKAFKDDLQTGLWAYDKFNSALKHAIPPACVKL